MWHEPARLAARRVLPQPPAADLAGWLPSERHPSDHLAVVADLEWLPGGADAGAPAESAAHSIAEPAGLPVSDGTAQAAPPAGSQGLARGGEAGLGGPMPQRRRPLSHAPAAAGPDAPGSGASARGPGASPARDAGADAAPAGSAEGAQGSADAGSSRSGRPPSLTSTESLRDAAAAEPSGAADRLQGAAGAAPGSSGAAEAVMPAEAPGAAAAAAAALASGGVVAVPTDTLYGLACDASCAAAVAAIYAIKVGAALHALLPCPRACYAGLYVHGLAQQPGPPSVPSRWAATCTPCCFARGHAVRACVCTGVPAAAVAATPTPLEVAKRPACTAGFRACILCAMHHAHRDAMWAQSRAPHAGARRIGAAGRERGRASRGGGPGGDRPFAGGPAARAAARAGYAAAVAALGCTAVRAAQPWCRHCRCAPTGTSGVGQG